jgi:hypothetical protein
MECSYLDKNLLEMTTTFPGHQLIVTTLYLLITKALCLLSPVSSAMTLCSCQMMNRMLSTISQSVLQLLILRIQMQVLYNFNTKISQTSQVWYLQTQLICYNTSELINYLLARVQAVQLGAGALTIIPTSQHLISLFSEATNSVLELHISFP